MSTGKLLRAVALLAVVIFAAGTAGAAADLGREVKPAEITAEETSIPPDGRGLPAGSGTASEGAAVYQAKCVDCHGEKGMEGPADRLVGGIGTLATPKPVKTVGSYWPFATTLFDYLRRTMPYDAPRSLAPDEVYALCAYLLFRNGIIGPEMRLDAKTLPQVNMPNRDGFVRDWP
jgi:cytochrome c